MGFNSLIKDLYDSDFWLFHFSMKSPRNPLPKDHITLFRKKEWALIIETSLLVALGFSLIHFGSHHYRLHILTVNQFTSFVGGISLSYVFFHLFPTLTAYEHEVAEMFHLSRTSAYHVIFGSILAGLVIFYLLEQAMQTAKVNVDTGQTAARYGVFWAHIASYFTYNLIIGLLLSDHRFETNMIALFYLVAIGLHFWTNDWVLRHHFEKQYDRYGKQLLTVAVLAGWVIGSLFHIPHTLIGLLEAFVAGGMILNAIKDELPSCKGKGFIPFLIGIGLYAIVLISL